MIRKFGAVSGTVTLIAGLVLGLSFSEAFKASMKAFGDGFASGFMSGGIGFCGGAFGQAVGGTFKTYQALQRTAKVFDYASKAMDIFEYTGELSNKLFPGNFYGEFYNKVSSNPHYQLLNKSVGYCSTFFGSASKQAKITDDTFKNPDGTYKKNVTFVDRDEYGLLEYSSTDKNGIIKSQTSESFWYKSVSTYNKEGNFEGLQIKSTVYDLSIKKIGKKVAPKVADVWLGKNKRINVYFQNYGVSQSLLTAFPK